MYPVVDHALGGWTAQYAALLRPTRRELTAEQRATMIDVRKRA
jgi:hypothetical protein